MRPLFLLVLSALLLASLSGTAQPGRKPLQKPALKAPTPVCFGYPEAAPFQRHADKYDYELGDYLLAHPPKKGKRQAWSDSLVRRLFLGGADSVELRDWTSGEVRGSVDAADYAKEADYYYRGQVARTERYTLLLLERMCAESAEQFLVTIAPDSSFIDRVRVAYVTRQGTYTSTNGARLPWYDIAESCLQSTGALRSDDDLPVTGLRLRADGHFAR